MSGKRQCATGRPGFRGQHRHLPGRMDRDTLQDIDQPHFGVDAVHAAGLEQALDDAVALSPEGLNLRQEVVPPPRQLLRTRQLPLPDLLFLGIKTANHLQRLVAAPGIECPDPVEAAPGMVPAAGVNHGSVTGPDTDTDRLRQNAFCEPAYPSKSARSCRHCAAILLCLPEAFPMSAMLRSSLCVGTAHKEAGEGLQGASYETDAVV